MTEQIVGAIAALVVMAASFMRLNLLHHTRMRIDRWQIVEASGLVILVGGLSGVVGELVLVNQALELHADTLVLVGAALFAIGVSHARFCELVARLTGWDGADRRCAQREGPQ